VNHTDGECPKNTKKTRKNLHFFIAEMQVSHLPPKRLFLWWKMRRDLNIHRLMKKSALGIISA
jgi:hypothetical protein